MIADAGSFIEGKPTATNSIIYRDAAKPPVLNGSIVPAPVLSVDSTLDGCPVCGNNEIDADETSDAGNVVPGAGCDEYCYLE